MSTFNKRHVLAAAIGTIMAGAASGQEGRLEIVVVTAEFRETAVQETPISITAVTGDMQ